MQNIPVLSSIAFGFIVIFSCAIYTLSQAPAQQAQAAAVPVPAKHTLEITYVDGPQADPPAWPAVLAH